MARDLNSNLPNYRYFDEIFVQRELPIINLKKRFTKPVLRKINMSPVLTIL